MRLQYIFHDKNNKPQPFHVKSTWEPLTQQSIALKAIQKRLKSQLTEIGITNPKNNMPPAERDAFKALKGRQRNYDSRHSVPPTHTNVLEALHAVFQTQRIQFSWKLVK